MAQSKPQRSRPMSSGHHVSMEHRLQEKHLELNSITGAGKRIYLKVCKEMNCDDMTRAINVFASQEPWMGSRQTSHIRKSPRKKENSAQRAQNSATRATARKTTLHRSEEGRSTGVSLGTKNKQTHSPLCVVLKTHHSSTCSHKRMVETLQFPQR